MGLKGRPPKKNPPRKTLMTYEEMISRVSDSDVLTVQYDGIEKHGYWYDDHMMKMFSECKMIHLFGNTYMVAEWPEKGE